MKKIRFFNYMYSEYGGYTLSPSELKFVEAMSRALLRKATDHAYIGTDEYEDSIWNAYTTLAHWDRYMYYCHAVVVHIRTHYWGLLNDDREDGNVFFSLNYELFVLLQTSKGSKGRVSRNPRLYLILEKLRFFMDISPRMDI